MRRLVGDVPGDWLRQQGYSQCAVCSVLLAQRCGFAHPRCRSSLQAAAAAIPNTGRPMPTGMPSLKDIAEANIPVKSKVPQGARRVWAECILTTAADVINFHDRRAWTNFWALRKLVLQSKDHAGKCHRNRSEMETKQRCLRLLEGHRVSVDARCSVWRRQTAASCPIILGISNPLSCQCSAPRESSVASLLRFDVPASRSRDCPGRSGDASKAPRITSVWSGGLECSSAGGTEHRAICVIGASAQMYALSLADLLAGPPLGCRSV